MAKSRATATQLVRANFRDAGAFGALLDHVPDHILRKSTTPDVTVLAYASEESSADDSRRRRPSVNRVLHPGRHGHAADASGLADKAHYDPMVFPALDEIYIQRCNFGAT
jgi:hypothetical protein